MRVIDTTKALVWLAVKVVGLLLLASLFFGVDLTPGDAEQNCAAVDLAACPVPAPRYP